MSLRLNRVNEAIEHEVNRILRIYFREETVPVTIVGALLSPDLKEASIKFSVIGNGDICRRMLKFFSKYKNFIKQKLCQKVQMRYTPQLKFELTDAIAEGNRLIDILNAIPETEM
ncbi:MAG: 30S ribosome-binding factor RbfA [Puniceicoccales bacterium]|jgi:ribosome-binding factor A|nr:30S ribosome-binding factor RbfA [Puniceicoccales bacterium]